MAGDAFRPRRVILASTSAYRRALLARLGLPFEAVAPGVDEESLKDPSLSPVALAERLALAKAESVALREPDALVVGSDQVVALGDEILGKPGTAERAVAQLRRLSGRTHRLITAVAVVAGGEVIRHTDLTTLTMRPLDDDALRRYVGADCPIDCAGSYKLEAAGIALFSSVESADQSAVTGLPLIALTTILRDMGYEIP